MPFFKSEMRKKCIAGKECASLFLRFFEKSTFAYGMLGLRLPVAFLIAVRITLLIFRAVLNRKIRSTDGLIVIGEAR